MENVELGNLGTITVEQAITAIYIGYYDRAPDPAGLAFHVGTFGQPTAGGDGVFGLDDIATDFSTQAETAAVHSFFSDPSATSALAFLNSVYLNLFGREADQEGIDYWVPILEAAVAGEDGAISVGESILQIIRGAQNTDAGQDLARIQNKIEVGEDFANVASGVSGLDYENNSDAQGAAKAALAGVDDTQASVDAALEVTNSFFDPILNPPVEGATIDLEIGVTRVEGTDGDDQFNAFPGQNQLGGVANTLSSASNLDGKGGDDRLHADLTDEFTGSNLSGDTDVQPRIKNIEEIDIEARDGDDLTGGVTFDAKNVTDVEEIGSYFSDGNLTIENLTTLTADGVARNTGEMTISMDHTGPQNSNSNASNLTVYFDNDYLINDAPVNSGALLTIELMDLDAETVGADPLEDNPFGLITFNFDGELKTLDFGTDSNTYAELLADIQAAIFLAAQTDADFSQLTAAFGDPFVVQDTDTDPNPAQPDLTGTTIVITNSGPELLEAVTMRATGDSPAGKDFHTGFGNEAPDTENFPISVNIDLHKAGRGGEGGDLVVGGKANEVSEGIAGGIEVFNVSVLGEGEDSTTAAAQKPSNIGTLTSTLGALTTVNIVTHEDFVDGDSFASLEIRDGFNNNNFGVENGDLQLVDANGFLGNLSLGTTDAIVNLDTLTALGGGDVVFNGILNGADAGGVDNGFTPFFGGQDYTYLTGTGDDIVNVNIASPGGFPGEGNLDFADDSLEIKTGDGDDVINVNINALDVGILNQQLNQAVLNNIDIDGEAGDDVINVTGVGNANIDGSAGNDVINTSGNGATSIWAFNFDNVRADTIGLSNIFADEIPGVQSSLAYLDGASITVTLSGAGVGNAAAGGGVMALPTAGAVQGDDGYESKKVFITDLLNGNDYYGDQRDVNLAIMRAIQEDDVLNAMLTVTEGPNNTLLINSNQSGLFDATDLRIDIDQGNATSADYANDVLGEARELFSDSDLTLTNLWGATTFGTSRAYEGTAPGANLTTSTATNDWFDGLSIRGGTNEADDNLHTAGTASTTESDNVINGGADDDIIILSTDATPASVLAYTPGGNNSLLDGSSNETIVMDGSDFGDDTVMNFTTVGESDRIATVNQTVGTVTEYVQGGQDTIDPANPGSPESFVLDVSGVTTVSTAYTVEFGAVEVIIPANATPIQIGEAITAAFAGTNISGYTAVDNLDGTVTFTHDANANQTPDVSILGNFNSTPDFEADAMITVTQGVDPTIITSDESFTVTFEDATVTDAVGINILGVAVPVADTDDALAIAINVAAATYPGFTAMDNLDGTVTFTSTTLATDVADTDTTVFDLTINGQVISTVPAALDFLDFTSYLTSLEDMSTASGGSAVSNTPIPVTLDFDLMDIQANEVAVVQFDNTPSTDSWAGLNASVVENLINGSATTADYGTLTASAANADDEYGQTATTDELIDGAAKAVVMIENADNLGEYKVFELTWDGDASSDTGSTLNGQVAANEIGSLDFGTSLDGLTDVNLVGSDAYGALIANGILA